MKARDVIPPLVMVLVLLAGVFTLIGRSERSNVAQAETMKERRQTEAFACGYLHGQRSIMGRLPALFKAGDLPEILPWCQTIAGAARTTGFPMYGDPK